MTAARTDVVVVGLGPVGMVAALLLARDGLDVTVLERHPALYPLPRAVHVDDEIVRVLERLGLAARFREISRPTPGLRLVDAALRTMAEFRRDAPAGHHGHPPANLFDQPELEALLLEAVLREPRIRLVRGAEATALTPERTGIVYRTAEGEQVVHGRAILGCDGANSFVRQAIGAVLEPLGFEERWLVVDLDTKAPLAVWGGVHQICDPRRAATFMHVVGGRYRWEFRMHPGETVETLTSASALAALLAPWFPAGLPAEARLVRAASYVFRAAIADRWRSGAIFLLGDAAHLTPPFIGQGLCTGVRDAVNLAWKLSGVLRGTLDEAVLDTYEAERRPSARAIVAKAIKVGWALTGGQGGAAAVRRVAVAALCRVPKIGALVLDTAMPALPRGPLVVRPGAFAPDGRSLPQPPPPPEGGLEARLGGRFALVTSRPAPALVAAAAARGALVVDAEDEPLLAAWLARQRRHGVLVRPDRIVAASARRPRELPSLLDLLPTRNPHA